ncbi:hypothetical protein LA080_010902, partial [Diaporthe eres]
MEAPDLRSPNRLSDQSSSASYPCFACGMIFSRNDHLKRHAQLHAGERPFVCPKWWTKLSLIRANQIATTVTSAIKPEKAHPVPHVGSQSSDVTARCRATGVSDTVVPAITRPDARDSAEKANTSDWSAKATRWAVRRSEGIHSTMERAQDLDLVCSTRHDDFIMTDGVLGGSSLSPIPGFSDYATNERPSLSFRFDSSWLWLWQGIDSQDESLVPSQSQVPMSQSPVPMSQSGSGSHDARGRQDAINNGTQSLASHQPCTTTSVDYLGFQTPAPRSPLIVSDNSTVNTGQETHPIPRGSNSQSTMPSSPSVDLDQLKGPDSHREAPQEAHADACDTDDEHSHVSLNDGVSDDYSKPGSGAHTPAKALSQKAYNDLCLW